MTGQILFGIDSLALGFLGTHPPDYYITLPTGYTKINFSISGQSIDMAYKNCATEIDSKFIAGQDNILVLWAGTNDIINGVSATAIYAEYVDWVQHHRALGWRVLICTLQDMNPIYNQSIKDQLNTLIYDGWKYFADGLIDIAGNANLGPDGSYTNTTYFQVQPNVHMTDAGYQLVASLEQTAINSLVATHCPPNYLENSIQSWGMITLASQTTVTSINLPPGDWDVSGTVLFAPLANSSGVWTAMELCAAGISLVANALPSLPDGGYNQWEGGQPTTVQPYYGGVSTGVARFSSTQPQTVYLVAACIYSGQGVDVCGKLRARKMDS